MGLIDYEGKLLLSAYCNYDSKSMLDFIFNFFQGKEERVEHAKQKFLDSLMLVESEPLNQNLILKSRELGIKYEVLARKLGVNINASRDGFDRIKDISIAHFRGLQKLNAESSTSEDNKLNTDELMVVISGNWGDIPMTLTEWIERGPGQRIMRSPFRMWNLRTGEELSLEKIPEQFRNDINSIKRIVSGELEEPWKRDIERLKSVLEEDID